MNKEKIRKYQTRIVDQTEAQINLFKVKQGFRRKIPIRLDAVSIERVGKGVYLLKCEMNKALFRVSEKQISSKEDGLLMPLERIYSHHE